MKGHLLSIVLFILGIVVFLVTWLAGGKLLAAILLGLIFILVGLVFYRRGK